MRPIVWTIAAVVTPFWFAFDVVRRFGAQAARALHALVQGLVAAIRFVTSPLRLLAKAIAAVWRLLLLPISWLGKALEAVVAGLSGLVRVIAAPFRLMLRALIAASEWLTRLVAVVAHALSALASFVTTLVAAPVLLLVRRIAALVRAAAVAVAAFLAAVRSAAGAVWRLLRVPVLWLGSLARAVGQALSTVMAALSHAVAAAADVVGRAWSVLAQRLSDVGRLLLIGARAVAHFFRLVAVGVVRATAFLADRVWRGLRWLARPFVLLWTVLRPAARRAFAVGRALGQHTRQWLGTLGRGARGGASALRRTSERAGRFLRPVRTAVAAVRRTSAESAVAVRQAVRALRRR